MDFFTYHNGALHAENVAVADIAEAVGTPFCHSRATLEHHYKVLDNALADAGLSDRLIGYSVKPIPIWRLSIRWRSLARR